MPWRGRDGDRFITHWSTVASDTLEISVRNINAYGIENSGAQLIICSRIGDVACQKAMMKVKFSTSCAISCCGH